MGSVDKNSVSNSDAKYSAPSTEYFPVRRSREERVAYLTQAGREDEAFQLDEE